MNIVERVALYGMLLFSLIGAPVYARESAARLNVAVEVDMLARISQYLTDYYNANNAIRKDKLAEDLKEVNHILNTATKGNSKDTEKWNLKRYNYCEQDMILNNVIVSNFFNHLFPGSFPRVKVVVSYDENNKPYLLGVESQDMNFMSVSGYGYEHVRCEGELDEDLEKRRTELKKRFYDKLNGVEELYVIIAYLGLPTPWSGDIGFSKDTGRAIMVNAAHAQFSTFGSIGGVVIPKSCFISAPDQIEYTCDATKISDMLGKISELDNATIDSLVDKSFAEVSSEGYDYFRSENYGDYKRGIKEVLKENRNVIFDFLKNYRR